MLKRGRVGAAARLIEGGKSPTLALPEVGPNPGRDKAEIMTHAPKLLPALLACLVLAATVAPIRADDFAFGRRVFLDKAQCSYCHGWAGDGAGEPQSDGAAANLRVTQLQRAQLIEVITCGVPGKAMPHFDEEAYTGKRCYGVTTAELGRDTPALPPGATLNKREIEAVADYLLAKVIGRGAEITRADAKRPMAKARACAAAIRPSRDPSSAVCVPGSREDARPGMTVLS
jgi:mono/diheme cytochrome c family protein